MSEKQSTVITNAVGAEDVRNEKAVALAALCARLDGLQDALTSLNGILHIISLELKNSTGDVASTEPDTLKSVAASNAAADPEPEPASAPAKKRRGRPKRVEAMAQEQGQDAAQPTPRRRGRPKKNLVAVEPTSEAVCGPVCDPDDHTEPEAKTADTEPAAVTQDLPFVPQDEQPAENLAGTLPYELTEPVIPAAPKKRGRPKKNPAPDTAVANTAAAAGIPSGKRRGRPRKTQAGNGETRNDAALQVIDGGQSVATEACEVPQTVAAASEEPAELSVAAELDAIRDIEQDIMQHDNTATLELENIEANKENGIIKLDHAKRNKKRKNKKKQGGPWDTLELGKQYDVRDAHKAIKNAEYVGTEEIGGLTLHCFKIGNELFKFSEPSLRQFSTITESGGIA